MCSVWQPLRIHDLGYRPGAGFGEIRRAGFLDGLQQSVSPDPVSPFELVQLGLEAGSFVQAVADTAPLLLDGALLTLASPLRRVLPFEQVGQQHRHAVGQLPLFASTKMGSGLVFCHGLR